MLRNVKQTKAKKPVMVMLHGSGSSAAIFGIQTHFLAKELSKSYDIVFLDGPTPSAPGPGVLPLFAGMPAYYRWLSPDGAHTSVTLRLAELFDVARYIQTKLDEQNIKPEDVVSIFGFSQGGLIALAMQGLRLVGQSVWENLRFCVAVGAGTTGNTAQMDGIESMMAMLSGILGREDGKFPGYSVQASGLKDLWYKDGRRLAGMCARDKTKSMDYRDGHVVPRRRADVLKLLQMIMEIDGRSQSDAEALSTEAAKSSIAGSLPPLLGGDDITQGLAVLSANGIQV